MGLNLGDISSSTGWRQSLKMTHGASGQRLQQPKRRAHKPPPSLEPTLGAARCRYQPVRATRYTINNVSSHKVHSRIAPTAHPSLREGPVQPAGRCWQCSRTLALWIFVYTRCNSLGTDTIAGARVPNQAKSAVELRDLKLPLQSAAHLSRLIRCSFAPMVLCPVNAF